MRLPAQLERHSVALISLVVALTSLAYNTWRNEQTEANRNVRNAGVQMLLQLGELDQVLFFAHYEGDAERGSPRRGWAVVLVLRDLATLMPASVRESGETLVATWQADWEALGGRNAASEAAATRISAAIERTRSDVRVVLANLD